ncbi:hypothetical protein [Marinomonas profundimaris]|nr:hypothetical protein [Marinomonas profundimaris]
MANTEGLLFRLLNDAFGKAVNTQRSGSQTDKNEMEVMMNMKRTLLNTALVLVTAATLTACGQDADESKVESTMSNAGDAVEQTMNDAGDALNSAGNAIEDTMTDAGNAVEDTCEDAKEGMNATDTDC